MGMFTELILGCGFKKNLPQDLVYTIATLAGAEDVLKTLDTSNCKMLFDADRNPLRGSSYYFIPGSYQKFWFNDIVECYYLMSRSDIKNYDDEIEKFLELIKPYIDSGSGTDNIYAYVLYEEDSTPTIYKLHNK
jgi:hypothetical protein